MITEKTTNDSSLESNLASKILKRVDETIGNLQLLTENVPDLAIDPALMAQLETIKISVEKKSEQLTSFDASENLLEDLRNQNQTLKGIIAQIGEAVKLWEVENAGTTFNVDEENPLSLETGHKHARLIELATIFEKKPMPGVIVPLPREITDTQIHAFLDKTNPEIKVQWQDLQILYQQHQEAGKPHFDFLKQTNVQGILQKINHGIKAAFSNERAFADLDMTEKFLPWLKQLESHESFLMVRSSGAEDSRTSANAGGNVSVPYVTPEPQAVCRAIGDVVASYFSEGSLQNRLNTNDNPFSNPLKLAVTTQELIGEPVGGSNDPAKIPTSLVLFTNEPTYIGNEKFRVMRISATFGHGEGVVGAAGVRSDTILVLRSVKYPDRLYILEDNQAKPKRLVPMRDDSSGKTTLGKIENPKELVESPSLDHKMLTRLFYLGVAVEKAYGAHPMDMELVVKGGIIYPVQARPINRPPPNPTYFDFKKAKTVTPTPMIEQFQAEAFLPGRAKTKILTKSDEILIADSLENAEKVFKRGQHKLVVVKQEEPANTHPVVNFSGMGIPVMYHEKSNEIAELVAKISEDKVLVACVQTGNLVLLDRSKINPQDCISSGYTVHPAKVAISVASKQFPKSSSQTAEVPQEIKNATMRIRAHETDGEALKVFKDLSSQIAQKRKILAKKIANRPNAPVRAQELEISLVKLESAFTRSISEAKALQKQSGDKRLHGLFHAKVIEQLTVQPENPRALGQLSVVNGKSQIEDVEKIFAYQEKFDFPTVFHDEILASSACMTNDQEVQWEEFLTAAEKSVQSGHITMEQVKSFKELLKTALDLDFLSLWMMRFFLPEMEKTKPRERLKLLPKLLATFTPETKILIQEMDAIVQEMQALEDNLNLFSDPTTFDKAYNQLMELHAKLSCANDNFKNHPPALYHYKTTL